MYQSSSDNEYLKDEEESVFMEAHIWTQSQVHHLKSDVMVVSNS